MSIRVLVVEDEKNLVELLRGYLEREGFEVHAALDGERALEAARAVAPDVVVLDRMLPGLDGLEVLRRMREFSGAYVIMLTARSEEADKISGLSAGADDYLTKPFSPGELVARVRAMLRRPRSGQEPGEQVMELGELRIDSGSREVFVRDGLVELTPLEFDLLCVLASRPGFVFSRSRLLERVWDENYYGSDHVVDVHIANLRKKIEPTPSKPRYIETVRGVGYRFARQG